MEEEIKELYKFIEYLENYIGNVARHMVYLERKLNRLDKSIKEEHLK